MQHNPKPLNTSLLSLFQFIGAILVIALHCRRLFEADQLHFIQKSIFSRMVVPYFMVTASFFLRRNYPSLSKQYLIRYSKQYLTWSILYLPFYLIYLTLQEIPLSYYPLALLVGLTYTGTSYQLWYMPAFLLGLVLVHFSFFLGEMGLAHHSLSSLPPLSPRLSRNLLLLPGRISFFNRI
ncbi:TPA: acyltransferase family protein [Streptococcus suis]